MMPEPPLVHWEATSTRQPYALAAAFAIAVRRCLEVPRHHPATEDRLASLTLRLRRSAAQLPAALLNGRVAAAAKARPRELPPPSGPRARSGARFVTRTWLSAIEELPEQAGTTHRPIDHRIVRSIAALPAGLRIARQQVQGRVGALPAARLFPPGWLLLAVDAVHQTLRPEKGTGPGASRLADLLARESEMREDARGEGT